MFGTVSRKPQCGRSVVCPVIGAYKTQSKLERITEWFMGMIAYVGCNDGSKITDDDNDGERL